MAAKIERPPLCGLSEVQVDALQAPLDPAHVLRREGKFDYVAAHHAIREANRIFGPAGWTRDSGDVRLVYEGPYTSSKGKQGFRVAYLCRVTVNVRTEDGWVSSDGWGYGEGIDYGSDPSPAHESAVKEAESDAMKRALVKFGDPFGLALYDSERTHVSAPEPEPAPDPGPPPGLFDDEGRPLGLNGVAYQLAALGCVNKGQRADILRRAAEGKGKPTAPEGWASLLDEATALWITEAPFPVETEEVEA